MPLALNNEGGTIAFKNVPVGKSPQIRLRAYEMYASDADLVSERFNLTREESEILISSARNFLSFCDHLGSI